jgi:chemosensory pili system protein ChpA (sensor histidine kinase/response regulator)
MSTISKIDPSTLGWVKTEIDESLRQAHIALESFAENPSDDTRLRFCVTHLHQVVGTLQMVELDGAAMLARETEALADAVLNERVKPANNVLELLTRAILLLPDYLSGLQFGRPDTPLRLLPLMNELRSARSVEPIAQEELFTPDLSVRPPPRPADAPRLSAEQYAELAQKLRPALQVSLLSWLRDTGDTKALASIAGAVEQLQLNAPVGVVEQLFWAAGGLLEALQTGGLEATNERKKLIARLDQQIKKLIDGADKSGLRTSCEALIKSILFELASSTSRGPKAKQLRQAFALDTLFGSGGGDDARAITEGPEPQTLQSVATALGEEVQAAQELLAAFFDPDQPEVNSLAPLAEHLRRFSATVELLDVLALKELVDELREVTAAVIDGRLEPTEEISMRMAHALLLIENCARDIWTPGWKKQVEDWTKVLQALFTPGGGAAPAMSGIEVAEVGETEFDQLVGVVAGEIGVNLAKVEEALEEFAADTTMPMCLDDIPPHLTQVQGALQILGEERALQLCSVISERLADIRAGKLIPSKPVLEALAVCVGTLSAYAEGLQHGRPNIDDLMDAAINDMDAVVTTARLSGLDPTILLSTLQDQLREWFAAPSSQTTLTAIQQALDDLAALAGSQAADRIARISVETNNLLSMVAEDPAELTPQIRETLERSLDALDQLGQQQLQRVPAVEPMRARRPAYVAAAVTPAPAPATPTPEPAAAKIETPAQKEPQAPPPIEPVEPIASPVPAEAITSSAAPATVPSSTPAVTPAAIDPELLEVFIDEAREVLGNIGKEFPAWRSNPGNTQALLEVRRGFHTLKGSGRMVGATEIGELAWAVENLLNKVRDRKVAHSDPIFELLTEVNSVLPLMIDQLAGGAAPTADIESLRQRAHALASGEPAPAAALAPAGVPPAPAAAERAPDQPVPLAPQTLVTLEPTLFSIFIGETRGHLDTIERELAACREVGGRCLVSTGLLRAVHTLAGSARSVDMRPMSHACGEMERLLEAVQEAGIPLEESHLQLLVELDACVTELIGALSDETRSADEVRGRFESLTKRIDGELVALPVLERADTDVGDTADGAPQLVAEVEIDQPAPAAPAAPIDDMATQAVVTPASEDALVKAEAMAPGLDEDIDPELVDVFLEEATDLLGSVEEALTRWRANPEDAQAPEDIKRALHTLKGGARMASALTVGNLAHNTEDLLKRVDDGRLAPGRELFDLLDEVHDMLVTLLEQIRQARPLVSTETLSARIARVLAGEAIAQANRRATSAVPPVPAMPPSQKPGDAREGESPVAGDTGENEPGAQPAYSPVAGVAERRHRGDAEPEPVRERRDRRGQVRVRASVLTDLVNYSGEVSITRSRMEQQVHGLRENLGELNRNITRFRDQIRELEIQSDSQILYSTLQTGDPSATSGFDPLELDRYSRLQQLARGLTESLHDLSTIQSNLQTYAGEAETTLQQQARINTNLQEGLMRTRMIAFSTQVARLRHIARQTARELGKRAELHITGTDVGVDRTVLERMMGPFEHMIRNAIDHGIEDGPARARAGKPATGKITIDTSQEGTDILIRFSDDGRGLDIDAIRRHAIERGLIGKDTVLADEELVQFILVSGFSTARHVTHLSGRGVGMDVVENEVKQLGGNMSVTTAAGAGTTFTIRLPVTLSITQALLVHAGDQTFAVPLSAVSNIIELSADKLNLTTGKTPVLSYGDKMYSFMHLAARLGILAAPRNGSKVSILLARVGNREVALQVDGLAGTREIVVKSLGPQLSEIKGLSGATILGDGTVLLILDVGGLWLTDQVLQVEHVGAAAPREARRPVVMVVDDSLTVRKVTGRHLQKRGMEVLTAKDGIDALEQLRERVADVILVDIEMPRMDGYELTGRVRSDSRLKDIPIIIITSRAGEKHRNRAFDLGVNIYMSKPYQEDELFKNIESLLPPETVH